VSPSGPVWAGAGAQIRLGLQCTGESAMMRCDGARFLLSRRVRQRKGLRVGDLYSRATGWGASVPRAFRRCGRTR